MFKKAYVEITDICNLSCPFCHGTERKKEYMSAENFYTVAKKLRPYTDYIYLHVLGEPLLHPQLDKILDICSELDFKTCITTNGTLLKQREALLLSASAVYKVSISLHSYEVNSLEISLENYLSQCTAFAAAAAEKNIICALRLWNDGGENSLNSKIISRLKEAFGGEWVKNRIGYTLKKGVYLEYGEKFDWPDLSADEAPPVFCMGLKDQIAVLCNGVCVPCCLDADGKINLGNLFYDSVDCVLQNPRAQSITDGFSKGIATEELCRKCGFAKTRFG